MPGVDDAALDLVGGETELPQSRVIQQLPGADVDGTLSVTLNFLKKSFL